MIEERDCSAANWRLCIDLSTYLAGHMALIVTLRYAHVSFTAITRAAAGPVVGSLAQW